METTVKKMTEEERRAHQYFIIQEWKKNVAEAKANLAAKIKIPEQKETLIQLKEENAKHGIIIPGKI